MSIVMVKKILRDGSACPKCVQAEQILTTRGVLDRIDRFVIAREDDPDSEGMVMAARYNVELAPFFVVERSSGQPVIYTRVFEFIREELEQRPPDKDRAETANRSSETFDVSAAQKRYDLMEPAEIVADAQRNFGRDLAIAFSGAEDVILIDMAARSGMPFSVFSLDTGRLHEETRRFLDTVRTHYSLDIEVFTPAPDRLEPFLREKGLNSFYRDGHQECCAIRKVEPLSRALSGRKAWATGLRRDQSPATRTDLSHVDYDAAALNPQGRPLVKFNPLLDWNSQRVWEYIRLNEVPYNPLHDQGYRSIGCEPCTRPSRPGEHERAARWWWEEETRRECGLHVRS